jgi:hypothetical protein
MRNDVNDVDDDDRPLGGPTTLFSGNANVEKNNG